MKEIILAPKPRYHVEFSIFLCVNKFLRHEIAALPKAKVGVFLASRNTIAFFRPRKTHGFILNIF